MQPESGRLRGPEGAGGGRPRDPFTTHPVPPARLEASRSGRHRQPAGSSRHLRGRGRAARSSAWPRSRCQGSQPGRVHLRTHKLGACLAAAPAGATDPHESKPGQLAVPFTPAEREGASSREAGEEGAARSALVRAREASPASSGFRRSTSTFWRARGKPRAGRKSGLTPPHHPAIPLGRTAITPDFEAFLADAHRREKAQDNPQRRRRSGPGVSAGEDRGLTGERPSAPSIWTRFWQFYRTPGARQSGAKPPISHAGAFFDIAQERSPTTMLLVLAAPRRAARWAVP